MHSSGIPMIPQGFARDSLVIPMNSVRIPMDSVRIPMDSPGLPYGFPWIPQGLPQDSHGFPCIPSGFPQDSHGFPRDCLRIPLGLPKDCLPITFVCFALGILFPMLPKASKERAKDSKRRGTHKALNLTQACINMEPHRPHLTGQSEILDQRRPEL